VSVPVYLHTHCLNSIRQTASHAPLGGVDCFVVNFGRSNWCICVARSSSPLKFAICSHGVWVDYYIVYVCMCLQALYVTCMLATDHWKVQFADENTCFCYCTPRVTRRFKIKNREIRFFLMKTGTSGLFKWGIARKTFHRGGINKNQRTTGFFPIGKKMGFWHTQSLLWRFHAFDPHTNIGFLCCLLIFCFHTYIWSTT